jgi:hypothetical protein
MTTQGKDVIYVDVEDEITNIIDKVNKSKNKVVALVLPKRASVFQSIVNMKLLKRKADDASKNVVLVTSEAGILPLAGAVKLHVARTLEAKPEIPPGPKGLEEGPVDLEDVPEEEIDNTKPIGELAAAGAAAGAVAVARSKKPPVEDDAIEVDNSSNNELEGASAAAAAAKKSKKAKDKKLKIPDFNRFKKLLIIGGAALVLLIIFLILATTVWPKGTVTIQTNTSTINTSLTVKLDSNASSLDTTGDVFPARIQTSQKSAVSPSVTTTGQKQVGTSATGSVTIVNPCNTGTNAPVTVPAGTVFTDPSGNFNFTSNSSVTVPSFNQHQGHCTVGQASIGVTATQVGSSYNISATPNYTSNDGDISTFPISGSNMTGGSSQTVQIVAQADLDSAQKQITAPISTPIEQQLSQGLTQAGFKPLYSTYVAGAPSYTPSAALGTQANSITVTENITYTMYGIKQNDAQTLIENNVNRQINSAQQSILDSGASGLTFSPQSNTSTSVQGTLQASSTIGPILNANKLKVQFAGKKSADIKSAVQTVPGVTNVTVKFSPFWVTSVSQNKLKIIILKANGSAP